MTHLFPRGNLTEPELLDAMVSAVDASIALQVVQLISRCTGSKATRIANPTPPNIVISVLQDLNDVFISTQSLWKMPESAGKAATEQEDFIELIINAIALSADLLTEYLYGKY